MSGPRGILKGQKLLNKQQQTPPPRLNHTQKSGQVKRSKKEDDSGDDDAGWGDEALMMMKDLMTPVQLVRLDTARMTDMQYARHVAGGMHVRSISAVWGPRDGLGLNMVDTKRMQDELFHYISEKIDDRMREEERVSRKKKRGSQSGETQMRGEDEEEEEDDDVEDDVSPNSTQSRGLKTMVEGNVNRNTGLQVPFFKSNPRQSAMYLLSHKTRQAREDFNRGWNEMYDIGIMNEVVNAELQIIFMLRKTGGISSWDNLLASPDPIMRVRLLRRCIATMAAFASTVGSVALSSMQTRPTVRPTRAVLQRAAVDTGLQFQMLLQTVVDCRFELQVCVFLTHAHQRPLPLTLHKIFPDHRELSRGTTR